MKIKYPYLSDNEFLSIVDQMNIREQVVKLTLLNWDEEPIRDIQGLVTGGSLNIDGSSSMRRTANISLVVADNTAAYDDLDNLFSINKKIYLEIGLFNTTNYYNDYPIIWFPQGLFIIDSISLSHDTNSSSISLSLKDKMCLLNGQCGGMLPASVTFHEIEEVQNDGSIKIITPTIYQIIQELVNHYGDEDLNRIIIEDIDEEVKQVVKWIGADALHRYDNKNDKNTVIFSETPIDEDNDIIYNYGYSIGYIYTPFTYPGELIGAAGQTVCDILDTIRDTLGNFEYFYDINGNFIFREIKNYLNITQSTVDLENLNNGKAYLVDPTKGKAAYSFKNSNIITSYSNSPQLNNVKNDFIIWGKREQIDKSTLPIRYHLAIDKKPQCTTHDKIWFLQDRNDKQRNYPHSVIPIMDTTGIGKEGYYYQDQNGNILVYGDNGTGKKQFLSLYQGEVDAEPSSGIKNPYVFWWHNKAKTYYQYVNYKWAPAPKVPIWADIDEENQEVAETKKENKNNSQVKFYSIKAKDYRTELLLQGLEQELLFSTPNMYYAELKNEWPLIYDILHSQWNTTCQNPTSLQWYLEIIDNDARIGKYSIQNI